MNEVKKVFEDIKHIDEYGNEYWSVRELCHYLNIAKVACDNSNFIVHEHFVQVDKMIKLAKRVERNIAVIKLMNIFLILGSCQKEINGKSL